MVRVSSDSQSTGLSHLSDQSQGRGVGDGTVDCRESKSGSPFPVLEVYMSCTR